MLHPNTSTAGAKPMEEARRHSVQPMSVVLQQAHMTLVSCSTLFPGEGRERCRGNFHRHTASAHLRPA